MGFDYEGLFEQIYSEQAGDLLSEYWRALPSGIQVGRMGYRTKTTKAGPRLEAEVYPLFGREARGKLREAKRNMTPVKQQRLNAERSERHFILLADGNFTENDIHLTLTWKDAPTEERARKDIRNFLTKVKRLRLKYGLGALKYLGMIEGNEGEGKTRLHVHLLMNGGIDRETLEKLWGKGYANADRLAPDENGLEAVARYIVKQRRGGSENGGRKKWLASRNLKQPKTRTSDTRMSNAKVKRIAKGFEGEAKEIMEKVYPGYAFVKCNVYFSDVVDGVYVRCVMRKREGGKK